MGSFSVIHNSGADRNSSNRPFPPTLCACCEKKTGEAGADQVILITIINEKGSVICI